MDLPEDVVRWVQAHFRPADRDLALRILRGAVIHSGEPASPRLLRCAAVGSAGKLQRLEDLVGRLQIDWRDVILWTEYRLAGRNFDGSSQYERIHDFDKPIEG